MTILCFLPGLCPRTKNLKFIVANCTHLQARTIRPKTKGLQKSAILPTPHNK